VALPPRYLVYVFNQFGFQFELVSLVISGLSSPTRTWLMFWCLVRRLRFQFHIRQWFGSNYLSPSIFTHPLRVVIQIWGCGARRSAYAKKNMSLLGWILSNLVRAVFLACLARKGFLCLLCFVTRVVDTWIYSCWRLIDSYDPTIANYHSTSFLLFRFRIHMLIP
jgi:hypothetical protein